MAKQKTEARKRITLRLSILAVYATTFIILMSTFIIAGSLNFTQSINSVAQLLMGEASRTVLDKLDSEIYPVQTLAILTQSFLEHGLVDDHNIINYSLYLAKNLPPDEIPGAIRVTGWADTEGNSIVTSIEDDGSFTTEIEKLKANPPIHENLHRDLHDTVVSKETISKDYDPRTQAWYTAAVDAHQLTWTDVFLSYPDENPTVAATTPIYDEAGKLLGVFEIEMKLVGVSDFLKTLDIGKDGVAFIVNAKDELIAFPGMHKWMNYGVESEETKLIALKETDKPWLAESLVQYRKAHQEQFRYKHDGIIYLANFEDIPEFAAYGWKVGVVVPEKSFVGNMQQKNIIIIGIGLGILLFGILVAMIFSKRISASIRLLVSETDRLQNFELDGGKVGESIIKEVDTLANAIYLVKINLRAFQKYMPATLVRQLIQSGEEVHLGGTKKPMTMFFSDIKDFTSIAEKMDPQALMTHLCEYFDNLSTIITDTGGTIDKFIGDSIMAFWGAPLPDPEHCAHACMAALACKSRLTELNAKWEKEGKPLLYTRIGIHTGEVIVGNIGSSDRINYTVVGDAVNLASRLEGMNKLYDTCITVSEDVVKAVGDQFVFRFLDKITIKGKAGTYNIYELVGESSQAL